MNTFTIAFICHNEGDFLSKSIEQNIKALCNNTMESYELILVLDGYNLVDYKRVLDISKKNRIDEIRLRDRTKNCASGDGANNGHLQTFSNKSKYLITVEGDVAIFKYDDSFDLLSYIKRKFELNKNLAIATRIDDYKCWIWKMDKHKDIRLGENISSVNRVSSHFLIYDTYKCSKVFMENKGLDLNSFFDNGKDKWFNYEDYVSNIFSHPKGPGIGYLEDFPGKVFHCDRKISKDSVYYDRSLKCRNEVFEKRKKECLEYAKK